jgi:hypothetical protein
MNPLTTMYVVLAAASRERRSFFLVLRPVAVRTYDDRTAASSTLSAASKTISAASSTLSAASNTIKDQRRRQWPTCVVRKGDGRSTVLPMVSAPVPPPSHISGSKKTQGGAGTP